MLCNVVRTVTPVVIFVIMGAQLLFGQQVVDNWKITPNADGRSAVMIFENPSTYLKIESDLEIAVDAAGTATRGTIHFTNGFQRAMTPQEVAYYLFNFDGDNAYWDFREKQGSIVSFASGSDPIPQDIVGKQVRAISEAGKFYIGILSLVPNSPDHFSLNIRNNQVVFFRNAVKEIQRLK
jgi:hypothetical protein